jgi:hypothetical protein
MKILVDHPNVLIVNMTGQLMVQNAVIQQPICMVRLVLNWKEIITGIVLVVSAHLIPNLQLVIVLVQNVLRTTVLVMLVVVLPILILLLKT